MYKLKLLSLTLLILLYLAAGINHFINPDGYIRIIPAYLPAHSLLNLLAGGFEILFALLLIFKKTRQPAAWGIILMLIAFLPVHITMVADAPLQVGKLMVTPLIAWLRLVVLQPLLILWAWWHTKPLHKPRNY
ncbi:hypothetical protein GCM10023149_32650 [Mucilaginibacter gynuensis]|uniref:Methylamine utilisation protein MauE domain-containing protein n=1 Tax=Mucilaginibacter gynuensis TaxID=1302236 RepID=A0ABP8GR70_9SPHI